jgi:hypothetical protein
LWLVYRPSGFDTMLYMTTSQGRRKICMIGQQAICFMIMLSPMLSTPKSFTIASNTAPDRVTVHSISSLHP